MKIFYKKIGIFLLIFSLLCICLDFMSMYEPWRSFFAELTNSTEFITGNVGSDEIIPYVHKVQEKNLSETLIIGDSVCHQMFTGLQQYNENICIVGSNGAITMAGQYILAKAYIENHTAVSDIYLILHPESLYRTFDTSWGYQYVVMPFVQTDTLKWLDNDTIEILENVYGKIFMKPEIVTMIDKSAINRKLYLNFLNKYGEGYQETIRFEIADQYIGKINALCEERNIKLHLCPAPVSEGKMEIMESLELEYRDTWLGQQFPEFFDRIVYFGEQEADDGTHFSGEFANQECYNRKIEMMFAEDTLLDRLNME